MLAFATGIRVGKGRDPVADYQDALVELKRRLDEFDDLRSQLREVAARLIDQWHRIYIAGVPVRFPPHVLSAKTVHVINGIEWPTAEKIAGVLIAAHAAHRKALSAWDDIDPDQRGSLPEPPRSPV